MQQIVQLNLTALRPSERVLRSVALHKSILNSKVPNYSGWLHFGCNASCQSRLLTSCVSTKYDSRSLYSHTDLQTNNSLWSKKFLLLGHGHTCPSYQALQSATLHTSSFKDVKLWEELLTPKNNPTDSDGFYLLNPESPFHHQIRSIHSRSKRRTNRTFSSQGSTPKEGGEKGSEAKELNGQSGEEQSSSEQSEEKLTLYQRFKKTYKEHGKVLVAVHLLTSSVWFGSFYLAARCGVDIVPLLESWNLSETMIKPFRSGGLGDLALAYLMYKLATPARYTVTIGGTNLAIRYLRKGGKMQPVAKQDTLREMYKEGKADLKTKSIHTRTKIRHMHTRIQGQIRRRRKRPSAHDRKKS